MDYLEIREESGIGKLIGVFCGQEIDSITSSSKLWIKFKSDTESGAKGFLADYSFLPGNELSGTIGRITSPLYPLLYKTVGTYSWRITVEVGYVIRLELKEIFLENFDMRCHNSLKVNCQDQFNANDMIMNEIFFRFMMVIITKHRSCWNNVLAWHLHHSKLRVTWFTSL